MNDDSKCMAKRDGTEPPDDWRRAYEVLGKVLEALEGLTTHARARALLFVILKHAPDAFPDHMLMELVRAGKEPQELRTATTSSTPPEEPRR